MGNVAQGLRIEALRCQEKHAMKIPFLIGRALFGGFFLYNGIHHFIKRKMLSQYAGAKGVPKPDAAVIATGGMMIIGGTSILLGIKPKLGAAAIIGFLAGVSPLMHDFWRAEDPNQRQNDMINFAKNLALLGGATALMAVEEPWPASVPVAQPGAKQRLRRFAQRAIAA
jgi:putative oxidoreductase